MVEEQAKSKRRRPIRLSIWQIIANIFVQAEKDGKKVNARHGVSIGNPEYHPKRGKFKGYMRDK